MSKLGQAKSLDRQLASIRKEKDRYGKEKIPKEFWDKYDILLRKRMDVQIKREIDLAAGLKKCSKLSLNPSDIKTLKQQKALQEFSRFSFFEAGVMETLFCAFDTNITVANPKDYTANDEVINFFTSLRQIGAESVEGFALFADFKEIEDLFVIKVPRNPKKDNLFHEYFVGVACLNKLRRYIPNFSYVFGAFNCLPPTIASNKDVTQWCSRSENGVNYVIFEKIEGPSMKKIADQIASGVVSFEDYFSYIIQISLALRIAWSSCGFTHYDLHDENVLLRQIPGQTSFYIPYPLNPNKDNGEILYIKTNGVPSFIDYGRSHVKLTIDGREEPFGVFEFEDVGLYHNISRPLHDLYKIIGFSMHSVSKHQTSYADDFLKKAWPLLGMWPIITSSPKDANGVRSVLENARNSYFEMGKAIQEIEEKEDPILGVIEIMKETFPEEWKKIVKSLNQVSDKDVVLDCGSLLCTTASGVKDRLIN